MLLHPYQFMIYQHLSFDKVILGISGRDYAVIFEQLTRLMAWEDFIDLAAVKDSDLNSLWCDSV
jgi:hypothetical protein